MIDIFVFYAKMWRIYTTPNRGAERTHGRPMVVLTSERYKIVNYYHLYQIVLIQQFISRSVMAGRATYIDSKAKKCLVEDSKVFQSKNKISNFKYGEAGEIVANEKEI